MMNDVRGLILGGKDFAEECIHSLELALGETTTAPSVGFVATEGLLVSISRDTSQRFWLEHRDPHFEIGCFLNKQVLLFGVEPDQITSPHMVFILTRQIDARTLSNEIKLQLHMLVHRVFPVLKTVVPEVAIPRFWQIEFLEQRDKI